MLSGFADKDRQIPPGQHSESESGACPPGEGSCLQTRLRQHEQRPPAWRGLGHRTYKETPRELGWFYFKRRQKEKLVVVFYGLVGGQREKRELGSSGR